MVRKFVVAALAIALVGTAAEAQRPVKVGIAAGVSLPTGDLADAAKSGFNVGGSVEFALPSFPVGIRIEAAFDRFEFDEDATGVDGNIRSISVTANGIVDIPTATPVKPYFIGGIGMYNLDSEVNSGTTTFSGESENKFGFNLGGGIRMPLGGLDTFLEARYHNVTDSDIRFVPITFGVRF